jgi:hypothetical protein
MLSLGWLITLVALVGLTLVALVGVTLVAFIGFTLILGGAGRRGEGGGSLSLSRPHFSV